MKQLPNHALYAFSGAETEQTHFRGRPVYPEKFYVGHEAGADIASGPFNTEAGALIDADVMTNTAGT